MMADMWHHVFSLVAEKGDSPSHLQPQAREGSWHELSFFTVATSGELILCCSLCPPNVVWKYGTTLSVDTGAAMQGFLHREEGLKQRLTVAEYLILSW